MVVPARFVPRDGDNPTGFLRKRPWQDFQRHGTQGWREESKVKNTRRVFLFRDARNQLAQDQLGHPSTLPRARRVVLAGGGRSRIIFPASVNEREESSCKTKPNRFRAVSAAVPHET